MTKNISLLSRNHVNRRHQFSSWRYRRHHYNGPQTQCVWTCRAKKTSGIQSQGNLQGRLEIGCADRCTRFILSANVSPLDIKWNIPRHWDWLSMNMINFQLSIKFNQYNYYYYGELDDWISKLKMREGEVRVRTQLL